MRNRYKERSMYNKCGYDYNPDGYDCVSPTRFEILVMFIVIIIFFLLVSVQIHDQPDKEPMKVEYDGK